MLKTYIKIIREVLKKPSLNYTQLANMINSMKAEKAIEILEIITHKILNSHLEKDPKRLRGYINGWIKNIKNNKLNKLTLTQDQIIEIFGEKGEAVTDDFTL